MNKELSEKYKQCVNYTRKKIRDGITIDFYIIQLVSHIEDLDTIINKLAKRLRDWYELYFPEISRNISDHETFAKIISEPKSKLMSDNNISLSMGHDFKSEELVPLHNLRKELLNIIKLRNVQLDELAKLIENEYPNMTCVAGPIISGKLLKLAGSMKKLIEFPASTLQLLGAEKALFRHLVRGSKPPKYGILLSHPFVASSKEKSKSARKLADKISIAAKVDYFKGEFIGNKLKEELK